MNKAIYTCGLLGLTFGAFAQNLQTISVNIANGNDDIEVSTTQYATSSDLELGGFDGGRQYVALRFQNVLLPANAQVSNAYLQFTAKVGNPNPATVNIRCQQGNAAAYLTTENLLTRPYVSNQIVWNSPAWFVTGESGPSQKTPNLAPQLNAAIATNWQSGNSFSFILQGNATTNDVLNARSFEHNATHAGAPKLVIEYVIGNNSNTINMANLTNIFVNEVAPKGTALFKEDWIELYNGNNVAVLTDSLYITGKQTQPFKWRLKNLRIPAKGFLRLIADKDTLLGSDHIDMKLSAAGEKFFLFKNVNGTPVELTFEKMTEK
jgi:trimeric autotransporter adhesin